MGFSNSWSALNYDSIEATENTDRPGEGGYIGIITAVYDNPKVIANTDPDNKEQYLTLELDIAEGPYKGYYKELDDRTGFWPLKARLYYTKKSLGMFKAKIAKIEKSNNDFHFNPRISINQQLAGKYVGMTLEQYYNQKGELSNYVRLGDLYTIEDIRKRNFKINKPQKPADTEKSTERADSDYRRTFDSFADDNLADDIQF